MCVCMLFIAEVTCGGVAMLIIVSCKCLIVCPERNHGNQCRLTWRSL